MYLVKRLFGKKETFLSQQEFNQEQLFLCSMDYRVNIAIEIFKSALEFTLGLTLLPDPLATLFFILSLSSLFTIVTLYQRTQINELYRITHSLLFEVVYLWNFGNLNYLLVYLIYVSSTIDREIMKIFYYVMFQIVYEMMNYKQFEIGKGEQIFVWLILISIILGLFVKNQKKQVYSPQQFSIANQEEDLLLDVNEKQYILIIKMKNNEILYMNKPFTNKFGNQCLILEQFMLQPSTDQDRSTEHYFQKSTSVLDTLNQSDLFQHVPINTNATMEDQIYKVNISVCNWKGQQAYAIVLINVTDETAIGEFRKLDSYKDSILATVSHDLKNPIGAIYQTLQFVQSDLEHLKHSNAQLEQVANFIDICLNNIQFLQSFIKDLSDFQQIKQQKLKLSHNYFDIIHLFHEVRQAFLFQLQLRQVEFQITKKVENPIVKNDETRLKQVLFNLISNSSKFTLNGQISLIVSDIRSEIQEFYYNVRSQMKQNKSHQSICTLEKQMSNVLLITISDTGVGISEDVQSQLFKSYSTFDNDKKVNRSGVGLGLMISKQLCGVIGPLQYIYINSKIGLGTSFQFTIYRIHRDDVESQCIDDEPIKIHQVKFSKTPKSVLLVDDELFNNATHKQLLQQQGISKISIAYSASEAYQIAKQKQFDFILLDINLPDKSGVHCIKDLKKYNKGAKIFILSAFDDQETIQQCLKEGADRILQKPLTQQQIQNIL